MNIRQTPPRARRLFVAAAVAGTVALAPGAKAQAQDQPQGAAAGERMDPRKLIDQRMEKLTETLKLDSAQQDKVRWILANETMDMEALRKNGGGRFGGGGGGGGGGQRGGRGGGRGGGRRGGGAPPDSTASGDAGETSRGPSPEMRKIRDSTNKQIEALLNPQQLTTYRQLFEQQSQQKPKQE